MSAAAAVARVSEIQAMIASATTAQSPAAVTSTDFSQQLMQASAQGPGLGTTVATAATARRSS